MDNPYQASADVHVLPTKLSLPGVGVLPINAYVVMAEEPALIDSGVAVDAEQFVDAVSSIVDPRELTWVWLTHDDADHTGNIQRIMELAPNAKLVTHGFAALRMSTWWPVPMDRVHVTDPAEFGRILDRVRDIQPRRIFSSHLPAANGTALEEFLGVLQQVPTAEPFVPPDSEQFAEMIKAMAEMQRAGEQVPAT